MRSMCVLPLKRSSFVPLTYFSYRTAYSVWLIVSLVLLAGACWLIERNTNVLAALSRFANGSQIDFGLLLVIFLGFSPTMECLLIGQDSMLMLIIYTLVFIALEQKREFRAGCLLACGLFKFHLVLPFSIIFLLRRRWSFLYGFTANGILLVAVSLLVSGPGALTAYPRMFFNEHYRTLMGFQPEYAANIRGLIFLTGTGRFPLLSGILVGVLSGLLLWFIATNWREEQPGLSFAAALAATLLTGYHLFVYDVSLLLLAGAIICGALARRNFWKQDKALIGVLLVLFLPPVHQLLIAYHIYALMCLPILALIGIVIRLAARLGTTSGTTLDASEQHRASPDPAMSRARESLWA